MSSWARDVVAVTLFVEDLDVARNFYVRAFEVPVHFQDDDSAVFRFGGLLLNLLRREAVPELIAPATMAGPDAGVRMQLTLQVDDVDDVCRRLRDRGVELLTGPQDRPWGPRTASFRDPAGHLWEIAS